MVGNLVCIAQFCPVAKGADLAVKDPAPDCIGSAVRFKGRKGNRFFPNFRAQNRPCGFKVYRQPVGRRLCRVGGFSGRYGLAGGGFSVRRLGYHRRNCGLLSQSGLALRLLHELAVFPAFCAYFGNPVENKLYMTAECVLYKFFEYAVGLCRLYHVQAAVRQVYHESFVFYMTGRPLKRSVDRRYPPLQQRHNGGKASLVQCVRRVCRVNHRGYAKGFGDDFFGFLYPVYIYKIRKSKADTGSAAFLINLDKPHLGIEYYRFQVGVFDILSEYILKSFCFCLLHFENHAPESFH